MSHGIGPVPAWTAASLVPLISALGAATIDLLPLPDTAPRVLVPSLLVAVCCYWMSSRPDLLPPLGLFALGTTLDLAGGMPPGATALGLLLARALLTAWRRFLLHQGPLLVWLALGPAITLIWLVRWAALSLLVGGALPLAPVALEAGLTLLAYPAVAWVLAPLQRRLPVPHHAARG